MPRKIETIKDCAIKLLRYCVTTDANGRRIGYSYLQILSKIKKRFPIVTYGGPHKGQPIRMTIKDLRKVAEYSLQDDPITRLPVRPRYKKSRRKKRT
jgi:hypothetical protein